MKQHLVILSSTLWLLSCGKSDSSQDEPAGSSLPAFDRLSLINHLSRNVVEPRYLSFRDQAKSLASSIDQACLSLEQGASWEAVQSAPRQAWQETMLVWQEVEAFQFGPIADAAGSLRYDIYVWPQFNSCLVDRQVATLALDPSAFQLSTNDGTKSLSAIEYLLFDADADHSCRSSVTETQSWNNREPQARYQFRCQYLKQLGTDLAAQAETLVSRWSNFQESWAAADSEQVLQARLNTVSDSLFFLESEVKDRKLGQPLGLLPDCPSATCPDRAEHLTADFALPALRANLAGFAAIFSGGSETAPGFDDYLRAAGGETLASQIQTDLDAAMTATDQLKEQGTFLTLLTQLDKDRCLSTDRQQRLEPLCALYRDIKAITDELKTEFAQILQLKIPAQSSGDND